MPAAELADDDRRACLVGNPVRESVRALRGLSYRPPAEGRVIDLLVFGTVIPSVLAPNIAREIALMPVLPKTVQAWSVSRACASANQAITDAADQIALGHAHVAIAGGAESLSNVPILHSRGFSDALVALSKGKMTETPVKTQFGYHIIRLDDVREAQLPKLEEVKPQIAQQLQQAKMSEYQQQLIKTAYKFDFPIHKPFYELTQEQLDAAVELLKTQQANVGKYWALFSDEIDNFKNGTTVVGTSGNAGAALTDAGVQTPLTTVPTVQVVAPTGWRI